MTHGCLHYPQHSQLLISSNYHQNAFWIGRKMQILCAIPIILTELIGVPPICTLGKNASELEFFELRIFKLTHDANYSKGNQHILPVYNGKHVGFTTINATSGKGHNCGWDLSLLCHNNDYATCVKAQNSIILVEWLPNLYPSLQWSHSINRFILLLCMIHLSDKTKPIRNQEEHVIQVYGCLYVSETEVHCVFWRMFYIFFFLWASPPSSSFLCLLTYLSLLVPLCYWFLTIFVWKWT